MKPILSPSLFLPSFLCLISVSVLQADNTDMKCEVSSCGNITNIRYPFWLSGIQPSYCGFPAFELRCQNGSIPLITMPSGDHQVKNIFYENNSLVVANDELVRSECPLFYSNLSFAGTPFAVNASTNRELYLFYNCSQARAGYFHVGCANIHNDSKVFAYLGGDYGSFEQQQETWSGAADYVIPVLGYPSADSSQYMTLIKKGFLLEWTVAECDQCTESKGRCGYSSEDNNFICICSDRLHWNSCGIDDSGVFTGVRIWT